MVTKDTGLRIRVDRQLRQDFIEDSPHGVKWHTRQTTHSLLKMMSDTNLAKVEQAKKAGHRMVGGAV